MTCVKTVEESAAAVIITGKNCSRKRVQLFSNRQENIILPVDTLCISLVNLLLIFALFQHAFESLEGHVLGH